MTAAEKLTLVRRLYDEVWSQGKLELFDDLYATNYIQHNPLPGQWKVGREELRTALRDLRNAFPDLSVEVGMMLERDDEVTAALTVRGHHQGEYTGVQPTGKLLAIAAVVIHRIADDRIVETWSSRDEESWMEQLGRAHAS